jgi:hypothetical protein
MRRRPQDCRYTFGDVDKVAGDLNRYRLRFYSSQTAPPTPATHAAAPPPQRTATDVFPVHNHVDPHLVQQPPQHGLLDRKPNEVRLPDKHNHIHVINHDDKTAAEHQREEMYDSSVQGLVQETNGLGKHGEDGELEPEELGDGEASDIAEDDLMHDDIGYCDIDTDQLLPDDSDDDEQEGQRTNAFDAEIRHAPLVVRDVINTESHLLPQYGLMGTYKELDAKSLLYLNTNTPFSAFICGVQGSGKSHTTSCILENSLIPSKGLGHLESSLSALVFSYGHFSGDGSGFSISEAAYLAAPSRDFPHGPRVKKVNVLVAPSNLLRISRLYRRIPNVNVTPFKLKPAHLTVDIMLTLMNVTESDEQPLCKQRSCTNCM